MYDGVAAGRGMVYCVYKWVAMIRGSVEQQLLPSSEYIRRRPVMLVHVIAGNITPETEKKTSQRSEHRYGTFS